MNNLLYQLKNVSCGDLKMSYPPTKTMAIVGLVLNLWIPGVGTLAFGGPKRKRAGIIQLILFIVGILFCWAFGLGAIGIVVAWIWALVNSIQILGEAKPD